MVKVRKIEDVEVQALELSKSSQYTNLVKPKSSGLKKSVKFATASKISAKPQVMHQSVNRMSNSRLKASQGVRVK